MLHSSTPWVGLAALIAMFVLPFLPAWLFEGPRTVKHWPRRVLRLARAALDGFEHRVEYGVVADHLHEAGTSPDREDRRVDLGKLERRAS